MCVLSEKMFIDIAIKHGMSYNVNYVAVICERMVESP